MARRPTPPSFYLERSMATHGHTQDDFFYPWITLYTFVGDKYNGIKYWFGTRFSAYRSGPW